MRKYVALVIVNVLVWTASPAKLVAEVKVKGWFDGGCSETTIHLSMSRDDNAAPELVFRLPRITPLVYYTTGKEWYEVQAKRCSPSGECEGASHARIWLDAKKANAKDLSGQYEVDFNGQHLQGRFAVKYRKPKTQIICE